MNLKLHIIFASAAAAVAVLVPGALSAAAEKDRLDDLVKISPPKFTTHSKHLKKLHHETVINTMHVLGGNRGLKLRPDTEDARVVRATKKSRKKGLKSAKTTCQAKLDACEAAAATPAWLFVQMADMCTLYRNEDGEYHIESSKFHQETEWFTDRPLQLEVTQPTSEWFGNFTKLFDDEDGMPNAALTIVHDDTSRDVVVSVFAEGYIKEGQTYGYKLDQSASQESVMALEALMDGNDSITFDHCSMFIDASYWAGHTWEQSSETCRDHPDLPCCQR